MNSSWADTVKCRLDAGKAPYFDRKVRVRIYTYRSRNGFWISYVYIRTKVGKESGIFY